MVRIPLFYASVALALVLSGKSQTLAQGSAPSVVYFVFSQHPWLTATRQMLVGTLPFPVSGANEIHRAEEIQCAEALNLESPP
ncbi:MAG: hypothetical protein JWL77_5262, partial [Chthonomonadaceae bacterium]|nr:hypothetical protein [Chthonomonadaceae bacterium]